MPTVHKHCALFDGPLGGSLFYIFKFSKANSTRSSQADVENEWALGGSIFCNGPLGGSLFYIYFILNPYLSHLNRIKQPSSVYVTNLKSFF